MTVLACLRAFFSAHGSDRAYWVAFSGGLDSRVLLHACVLLRDELALNLQVVHINHGLSPHAIDWEKRVAAICSQYQVPSYCYRVHVCKAIGTSLEEEARKERYNTFARCLQPNDMLLMAHHQDDQAETFLLQLMRGAGLKGLAGMPVVKAFAQGLIGRPLLDLSRANLHKFAIQQGLDWVDDESNWNIALRRNFIRHEVMPLLNTQWPSAGAMIVRSAKHCAESQALLEEFSTSICNEAGGSQAGTLSVEKLSTKPLEQQRLILRTWIHHAGYPLPNQKKLNSITQTVLLAQRDRMPIVSWGKSEVRRYQDDLYLQTVLASHDASVSHAWQLIEPLIVPGVGVLQATKGLGIGLKIAITNVTVRFRQGGEQILLFKRGHHTLKNLFQEWKIAPWLRNRIPLLYLNDELIGVLGYYLHPEYQAAEGELGWIIKLFATAG